METTTLPPLKCTEVNINDKIASTERIFHRRRKRGSLPELIMYQQILLKLAGDHDKCLTEICNIIWRTGEWPTP